MTKDLPLLKGTLDLLVLKTLSWGPMHGVEITLWLEQRSGGSLAVEDSALYYALHRLEERKFVNSEFGLTENNRRARYYSITAAGRKHLAAESERFVDYAAVVTDLLRSRSRTA